MKKSTKSNPLRFGETKRTFLGKFKKDQKYEEIFNGFITIRLSSKFNNLKSEDLLELAKEFKLSHLYIFLEKGDVKSSRMIRKSLLKQVAKLEENAKDSEFPPLRSLTTYWKLDFRGTDVNLKKIVKQLKDIPGIEDAYRELTPSLPTVDISDDQFAGTQNYLQPAPLGVDAQWAWTQADCEGSGTGFVDCEWGWNVNHEDLTVLSPTVIFNDNCFGSGGTFDIQAWFDHGTAVLGEVMGTDNNLGIVGVAPSIDYVKMSSFYDASTDNHANTAEAIVAAIPETNIGDVILLEIQKGFRPTEVDIADFDAIRLAVANGRVVVEAAGNGGADLDSWTDGSGDARLNRNDPDFQDSGAIMVGASLSTVSGLGHDRWASSNFGSRIDCYAYGQNVVTSGYGLLSGTTNNDAYTATFGGTSSASPIIVGCALIIQGKYKTQNGTTLSPTQMRGLLSDPANGTPQGTNVAGFINVMPNLRTIIDHTLNLVPDVYIRDNVSDNGTVPSTGNISSSPDIIVLPTAVADPDVSFGEGSGNENNSGLGYMVEMGQDNFIYSRFKNRGNAQANNVSNTVFWSEVSTLVTPDMWNLIGSSNPVNVPTGNTLVVTDPIVWDRNQLPGLGHYCFVGIVNSDEDPAPPIPPVVGFDWNNFTNFIRNQNNVTWRNFNVIDDLPDPPNPPAEYDFRLTNAPDKARVFDIEIIQALPDDVDLWLEIPARLAKTIRSLGNLKYAYDKKSKTVRFLMPKINVIQLNRIALPAKARYKCKFLVKGKKSLKKGTHYFGVVQKHDELEVGRVTWALNGKGRKKLR